MFIAALVLVILVSLIVKAVQGKGDDKDLFFKIAVLGSLLYIIVNVSV